MLGWYNMVRFGSVRYKNLNSLHVATNDRDSTSAGQSEWKAMTDQLTLTVSLQLVRPSHLSSSLLRALETSVWSPVKLVDESAHIAQRGAYRIVILWYGTFAEADGDFQEWSSSIHYGTHLHASFFSTVLYQTGPFQENVLV